MSTNALIKIEDCNISLYKHWDGYPEATLGWLTDFHKDFLSRRGWDVDYEIAQLVRSSARDADTYSLDDSAYTGWALVTTDETTDYVYTLTKDGNVTIKNGTRFE